MFGKNFDCPPDLHILVLIRKGCEYSNDQINSQIAVY